MPLHIIQRQTCLRVDVLSALQVAFRDMRSCGRRGESCSVDLALLNVRVRGLRNEDRRVIAQKGSRNCRQ